MPWGTAPSGERGKAPVLCQNRVVHQVFHKMRNYTRKTKNADFSQEDIIAAVKMVTVNKVRPSHVAEITSIKRRTLLRYVKKFAEHNFTNENSINVSIGFGKPKQVCFIRVISFPSILIYFVFNVAGFFCE